MEFRKNRSLKQELCPYHPAYAYYENHTPLIYEKAISEDNKQPQEMNKRILALNDSRAQTQKRAKLWTKPVCASFRLYHGQVQKTSISCCDIEHFRQFWEEPIAVMTQWKLNEGIAIDKRQTDLKCIANIPETKDLMPFGIWQWNIERWIWLRIWILPASVQSSRRNRYGLFRRHWEFKNELIYSPFQGTWRL